MLGITTSADQLVKANGVHWYGHVVRRTNEDILRRALAFEVDEKRKRGRPRMTWIRQVKDSMNKVGPEIMVAANRAKWREGVRKIAESTMRCIRPPPSIKNTIN